MIYISLGSNLGNRIDNLKRAEKLLKERCLYDTQSSIVIETTAIIPEKADRTWDMPYLNMIVAGETDLSPAQLMLSLKAIETEMGRPTKRLYWSPRIIDLDILLWDDIELNTSSLVIPHPELKNRPFLQHLLSLMDAKPWREANCSDSFTRSFTLSPSLVGVVNITNDSFSDGGQFNAPDKALEQILKLADEGASIVEIGAQSTRPGAKIINPEIEYKILAEVLDRLEKITNKNNISISVDTFWPDVIHKLLDKYNIAWINDVKGDLDDETLRFIKNKSCKLCTMHSLSIPPSPGNIMPLQQKPIEEIRQWAEQTLGHLLKLGFKNDDIVLDPGIGFGKNVRQNLELLSDIGELKSLNVPVMLGHSRKSYIDNFSHREAKDRDLETIAISLAVRDKIDYLRVHNIEDHMRALVANGIVAEGSL